MGFSKERSENFKSTRNILLLSSVKGLFTGSMFPLAPFGSVSGCAIDAIDSIEVDFTAVHGRWFISLSVFWNKMFACVRVILKNCNSTK